MKPVAFLAAAAAIVLAVGGDGPPKPAAPPSHESLAELLRPIPCDDLPSREILDALEKPVDLDYDKVPLSKIVDDLRPILGGNFMLDDPGLENAMIAPDMPVTFHCRGIRLRCALTAMLRPHQLTITYGNQIVYVTDLESQRKRNATRVYPAADLWSDSWVGNAKSLPHLLIDLLTESVDREVWEANGGDATIRFYPPTLSLVINCPVSTHAGIQAVLDGLRRASVQRDAMFRLAANPVCVEQARKLAAEYGAMTYGNNPRPLSGNALRDIGAGIAAQAKRDAEGKSAPPPTKPEPKAGPKPPEAK